MSSILADIGTKVGQELKNLDIRLTTAEEEITKLGGQVPPPTGMVINPVSWTNLSEINLSGEKLLNTDFSSVSSQYVADPDNDGSYTGTGVNPVKIIVLTSISLKGIVFSAGSILHGVGGGGTNNSLIRMEDPNDPRDYPYTTSNQNTGTWDWENVSDRGVTWEYAKLEYFPTNWSVNSAVQLDQDKLSQGIIKGDGGAVSIQQMFSNPIANGTKLVAKITRADNNETGEVRIQTLRASGTTYGTNKNIPYADGFVEFETTETTYGIRLSTAHGTREVSSISLFQGVVSGGTVQANSNGGLEKIAGVGGWNAGASSSTSLDGNSDGYVQFQWGSEFKSQRVGFTYLDVDYDTIEPFQVTINGNGSVFTNGLNNFNQDSFAEVGDFFRIRHYASTNQVHFQKRQTVYSQNADFVIETASGSNYNYPSAERPLVIAIDGTGNLTIGQYYEIYTVRATDQAIYLRDLDGNAKGWHGVATRNNRWQVVEELGEDYVTFHIHSTLTNGNNLFVDTSLYHVGSQLNDVFFAKQDNT